MTTGNVSAEEVGIDAAWESGPILAVLADKAEPFVISMIHSIISSTISDAQVTQRPIYDEPGGCNRKPGISVHASAVKHYVCALLNPSACDLRLDKAEYTILRLAPESSAGPLTHLDTYSGVDVVQIGISRKLLNVLSRLARRSPRLAPNYSAHLSKARGTRLQSSGQELPSRTPWSAHRLRLACLRYQEACPQAGSSANWHLFFMHF